MYTTLLSFSWVLQLILLSLVYDAFKDNLADKESGVCMAFTSFRYGNMILSHFLGGVLFTASLSYEAFCRNQFCLKLAYLNSLFPVT